MKLKRPEEEGDLKKLVTVRTPFFYEIRNDAAIQTLKLKTQFGLPMEIFFRLCTLGVKVRNLKVNFKTGSTWHRVGQ